MGIAKSNRISGLRHSSPPPHTHTFNDPQPNSLCIVNHSYAEELVNTLPPPHTHQMTPLYTQTHSPLSPSTCTRSVTPSPYISDTCAQIHYRPPLHTHSVTPYTQTYHPLPPPHTHTLSDLPPLGAISVKIFKENFNRKKRDKVPTTDMGKVDIPALVLEGGQVLEKW